MEGKLKVQDVFLDENIALAIADEIRKKSVDCYLLFELVVHTGKQVAPYLRKTCADMRKIIANKDIPRYLCNQLEMNLNGKLENSPFFRAKWNRRKQLSKRSFENLLLHSAQRVGIERFGSYTLSRLFFYRYFRDRGYDFDALCRLFRKYHRPSPRSIEEFLDYCGIEHEEYIRDYQEHQGGPIREATNKIDHIRKTLDMVEANLEKLNPNESTLAELSELLTKTVFYCDFMRITWDAT